jgi:hypothetical protein
MDPVPSSPSLDSTEIISNIDQAQCENLQILMNPEAPTKHDNFTTSAEYAQLWADLCCTSAGSPLAANWYLTEWQEIIVYRTS